MQNIIRKLKIVAADPWSARGSWFCRQGRSEKVERGKWIVERSDMQSPACQKPLAK